MGKVSIKVDYNKRSIQVFSQTLEKELERLISLACCYNATYNFDKERSIFKVLCSSNDAIESLKEDYQEYFFAK